MQDGACEIIRLNCVLVHWINTYGFGFVTMLMPKGYRALDWRVERDFKFDPPGVT